MGHRFLSRLVSLTKGIGTPAVKYLLMDAFPEERRIVRLQGGGRVDVRTKNIRLGSRYIMRDLNGQSSLEAKIQRPRWLRRLSRLTSGPPT